MQFSVCDTFNCDTGINRVNIPNCGDVDFGQKIVKIFIARMDAADFTDVTDLATEATWTTKLAINPTAVTYANRIVAIGDLHNGLKPAVDAEMEEAPYGGDELVSRKHKVTFDIKRWNAALVDSINNLRCRDQYKMWMLTNTGWLFGGVTGYENTSINWGGLEFNGIGNGKSKSSNAMSWYAKDDSKPVQTTFLKEATNSN